MTVRKRAVAGIALLILLTPLLVAQSSGRATFGWVIATRANVQEGGLTVTGDTTLADTTVGGTLTMSGGDVAAEGVAVGADLMLEPAETIVVTVNGTITPLGSYQPISSTGTVQTASITAGTAGDLLILTNVANTSIVFTDTGTLKLSGNLTLGQYDSVTLLSDGTNWVQLSTANN